MQEGFRDALRDACNVAPEQRLVVGYSGGADSTCLLHLLRAIGQPIVSVHIDHAIHADSEKWAKHCAEMCDRLAVELVSARIDVPALQESVKGNLESVARQARHGFLERVRLKFQADLIALGHTSDDLVETMLFNLTRGSGIAGLCSLRARRGDLVRPLLTVSRRQSEEYCRTHDLPFLQDPSNEDLELSRVRIRRKVVPELEAINPALREAFLRMARIAESELEILESVAATCLESIERPLNGDLGFVTADWELALDRKALQSLPEAMQMRALIQAGRPLGVDLDFHQTRTIYEGLENPTGSVTPEGGELVVEWNLESVHYRHLHPPQVSRTALEVPGELASTAFGWRITTSRVQDAGPQKKRRSPVADLNLEALKGDLYIRSIEPGDRLAPLGFDHERKLNDMAAERGLTATCRRMLPIVCDMVGPVWFPGVAVGERAAHDGTGDAVRLEFGPIEPADGHNVGTTG